MREVTKNRSREQVMGFEVKASSKEGEKMKMGKDKLSLGNL
jgi:hypothetical protein